MQIETASITDLDMITDLWIDLAKDQQSYGSHLATDANREAIRMQLASSIQANNILLAKTPSIIGFVMFSIAHGALVEDVTRGRIHNIFVARGHRNKNVGTDLLTAAENRLARGGADVVALEAMANNEQAHRFYESAGYRQHRIEFEKRIEIDTHSNTEPEK